jgi:hypothetical protein
MAIQIIENRIGLPPIGTVQVSSATSNLQVGQSPLAGGQAVPLGTIVRADDSTNGEGEFIYLAGVASTVVGSLVTFDPLGKTTALVAATASLDQPLAVATAASTLHCYGWYQISGVAAIAKTTIKFNPSVKVYLAGSGQITSTAATNKLVMNARTVNAATVASATTTIKVLIERPFAAPAGTGLI